MDFGDVIRTMKMYPWKRFAREGWNGKGMFIYLSLGSSVSADDWRPKSGLTDAERESCRVQVLPHIDMCSATGERVIGWLASQTDMLAEDWHEVDR